MWERKANNNNGGASEPARANELLKPKATPICFGGIWAIKVCQFIAARFAEIGI